MFTRLWLYLKEMYPPLPSFAVAFLSFFNLYFVLQILTEAAQGLVMTWRSVAGALTVFLFLLFLRISDEFKDEVADRVLFPHRPLPSGRVLRTDLQFLMRCTLLAMFLLNLGLGWAGLAFALLMLDGWLMLNYFFVPHIISKRLILALVTHNPSVLVLNIYVMAVFWQDFEQGDWLLNESYWLLILCWLPGLAWELSRKIKTPEDENDYETYSKIFGYKLASALPLMVILSHYFLLHRLGCEIYASDLFLWTIKAMALVACMGFLTFIFSPTSFLAGRLKPLTEAYMLITTVGLFIQLLGSQGLSWRWG